MKKRGGAESLERTNVELEAELYEEIFTRNAVVDFLEKAIDHLVEDVIGPHLYLDLWKCYKELEEVAREAQEAYLQEQADPSTVTNALRFKIESTLRIQARTLVLENVEVKKRLREYVKVCVSMCSFLFGAFVEISMLDGEQGALESPVKLWLARATGIAPFGRTHAQVRIGHRVFTRHLEKDGRTVSSYILQDVSARADALDIPLLPVELPEEFLLKLEDVLTCPYSDYCEKFSQLRSMAGRQLITIFYMKYPEQRLRTLCKVIVKWSQLPYDNMTSNCHHFVEDVLTTLGLRWPSATVWEQVQEFGGGKRRTERAKSRTPYSGAQQELRNDYHRNVHSSLEVGAEYLHRSPRAWLLGCLQLFGGKDYGGLSDDVAELEANKTDLAAYIFSLGKFYYVLLQKYSRGVTSRIPGASGQAEEYRARYVNLWEWGILSYEDLIRLKDGIFHQLAALVVLVCKQYRSGDLMSTKQDTVRISRFSPKLFTPRKAQEEAEEASLEGVRTGWIPHNSSVRRFLGTIVFDPPIPPRYGEPLKTDFLVTLSGSKIPIKYVQCNIDGRMRPTILYSHDSHEDLSDAHSVAERLSRRLNVNVLCYEYTGYGWSHNVRTALSPQTLCNDILAVHEYVTKKLTVPNSLLVLYGKGLGTALSITLGCNMVEGQGLGGILLEGGFANLQVLASYHDVQSGLNATELRDWFNNGTAIEKSQCFVGPILVFHAYGDSRVPWKHAEMLSATISDKLGNGKLVLIPGVTHNNLWEGSSLPWKAARTFLDSVVAEHRKGKHIASKMSEIPLRQKLPPPPPPARPRPRPAPPPPARSSPRPPLSTEWPC